MTQNINKLSKHGKKIFCKHNSISRFTHGFFCLDCDTFFSKYSSVYMKTEMMSDIWMTLWNINVDLRRSGKKIDKKICSMLDKIGIGKNHDKDYRKIICESNKLMNKYNKNSDSSTVTFK